MLVICFLFIQSSLMGQFEYHVKVLDVASGEAVSNASVFEDGSRLYYTDKKGMVKITSRRPEVRFYINEADYFGSIVTLKSSGSIQSVYLTNRNLKEVEIVAFKTNLVDLIEQLLKNNNEQFPQSKDTLFYNFLKVQIFYKDTIKKFHGNMFVKHKGYKSRKKTNKGYISDFELKMDSALCFSDEMDSIVYFSLMSLVNRDIVLKDVSNDYMQILRQENQSYDSKMTSLDSNTFQLSFSTSSILKDGMGSNFIDWTFLFNKKDSLIKSYYGTTKAIYKNDPFAYDSILYIFEMEYTSTLPKQLQNVKYMFNIYTKGNLVTQYLSIERKIRFEIKESFIRIPEYGPLNYQEVNNNVVERKQFD